jgi:hypothetical protein
MSELAWATTYKKGNWRGIKFTEDGINCACTIWYPLDDNESIGYAFDLMDGDIDELINLLLELKHSPPDEVPEEMRKSVEESNDELEVTSGGIEGVS